MSSKIAKFKDEEYRHAYAESFLDTFIATQIRVLREQREWTQGELADLVGMKQSRISTIEDASYSGWSLSTLKRLARAFDVPLSVSFGTFGRLLVDVHEFNRANLQRPKFADDQLLQASTAPIVANATTQTDTPIASEDTVGNLLLFRSRSSHHKTVQTRSTTGSDFTTASAGVS